MRAWPTIRVAGFMAWRSIARGNIGVLLMTVAVMGAVFAQMIFVPALIQGAKEQVERVLRDTITASVTVTPVEPRLVIADPDDLIAEAEALAGVAAATATVLAGTQISHAGRTGSWSVVAVDPVSFADVFTIPDQMVEGRFLAPDDNDEIVLGLGIAGADRRSEPTYLNSLRTIHAGNEVTVAMLGGSSHTFTVVGIYQTDIAQASVQAFLSRATAERVLPLLAGQVSAIYLRTSAVGDEAGIIGRLAERRPDVTYESWQSLGSAVAELTESFDVVGAILGIVSLSVAVIVVVIVTYIDLVSKRRTIGIERAIGIFGSAIVLAYIVKAAVFAFAGALAGAALFSLAAVPIVDANPFDFPIGPVTLSAEGNLFLRSGAILVAVAMMGALVPAWRTVRMRLLEAIWG